MTYNSSKLRRPWKAPPDKMVILLVCKSLREAKWINGNTRKLQIKHKNYKQVSKIRRVHEHSTCQGTDSIGAQSPVPVQNKVMRKYLHRQSKATLNKRNVQVRYTGERLEGTARDDADQVVVEWTMLGINTWVHQFCERGNLLFVQRLQTCQIAEGSIVDNTDEVETQVPEHTPVQDGHVSQDAS